jgi:hypothetical protein
MTFLAVAIGEDGISFEKFISPESFSANGTISMQFAFKKIAHGRGLS